MSERIDALLKEAVDAHLAGRHGDASALYARVLRLDPREFRALHLGGAAAYQLARMEESVTLLRRAIRVRPLSGSTHMCLGLALSSIGLDAEAEKSLKAGIALDKDNPEAWLNLGAFLLVTGRNKEAMSCYQQALKLKPGYAAAFAGIGEVSKAEGHAAQAIASYRLALEIDPGCAVARIGLVQALQSCNRIAESLAECERLLALDPGHTRAASSRLFLLNYLADMPRERIFAEHAAFGRLFARAPKRRFNAPKDPRKRIRVAFLSPDLRAHSVAFFLAPMVAHLDPARFEVVLYHDNVRADGVSDGLRSHAALWRNFAGKPDTFVEKTIRSDGPDILVDLAGHSGQNRVHLYSRRLAPVQVTYLGYPNTTGMDAMDYRFTDGIADPPGMAEASHVERLVRFSRCAWSYEPSAEVEAAGEIPPAGRGACVTFGSFNNLCKVNDATLRLWARVMEAVPGSRLVLKSFGLDASEVLPRLGLAGIDPSRVALLPPSPDIGRHLACYQSVDVALDPFPYGGTTTTCEALWMGRPVVTLEGDRHAARVGASLLTAIGRGGWIARDPGHYVRIAASLAGDRPLLARESAGLRGAMLGSPLLDHHGQAHRFGEALRSCWERWCGSERGRGADLPEDPIPR